MTSGHIPDGDDRPPLLAEFAEDLAFGRDDAQRYLGVIVGEAFERGQRRIKERQHERPQRPPTRQRPTDDRSDIEEPPP
jgi:hypothetical protein